MKGVLKMRKKLVLFVGAPILMVLCLFQFKSHAASIGNLLNPIGNMKVAVATEGNFVFDRKIEANGRSTSGSNIDSFNIEQMYQENTKIILGITDYVNVFTKLGVSKIANAKLKFSTGENCSVETGYDFLYGGGIDATYKFGNDEIYFVGFGGDISYFETDTKNVTIEGTSATNISGKIKTLEYQIAGFAGMDVMVNENLLLTPYVAGFWNKFNTKTGGIDYTIGGGSYELTFDSDAKDEIGVGVGLDLELFKHFNLNVEGRFAAGNAVTVGAAFKF